MSDQDLRNSPLIQKGYGPDTCILVKHNFRNSPRVTRSTVWGLPWRDSNVPKLTPRPYLFNPLALELGIYSLAHYLNKMLIFYEPRRVTLGNTRYIVEE